MQPISANADFLQAYISFQLLQKCLVTDVWAACELQASTSTYLKSYLQPNINAYGSSFEVQMSSSHSYMFPT